MSEWTGTKQIRSDQLSHELGHPALSVTGPEPDGKTRVESSVSQMTLDTTITAHVASGLWTETCVFPAVPPTPVPADLLRLTKNSDQAHALTSYADITELGFPVQAGVPYWFHYHLGFHRRPRQRALGSR
jgi:hypothetical protein